MGIVVASYHVSIPRYHGLKNKSLYKYVRQKALNSEI